MRFYASLQYYLNLKRGDDTDKYFTLTVHGMSNSGKSTLMWTCVEILGTLFPDIVDGGVFVDMYTTLGTGSEAKDILVASYVIQYPCTSKARMFRFNYEGTPLHMKKSFVSRLTDSWLKKELPNGKTNQECWLHFSDGKRLQASKDGSILKHVVFSSSHACGSANAGAKKTKFSFLLSPWTMDEVVRLWVLVSRRLHKEFLPEDIKRRYCISPSTLEYRWHIFGGDIGCIFPENGDLPNPDISNPQSQLCKWWKKLNEKCVASKPHVLKAVRGEISDTLLPKTNKAEEWVMYLRDSKGEKERVQGEEKQAILEKLNSERSPDDIKFGFKWEDVGQEGDLWYLRKKAPIQIDQHVETLSSLEKGFYECLDTDRKFVSAGARALKKAWDTLYEKSKNPQELAVAKGVEFEKDIFAVLRGEKPTDTGITLMLYRCGMNGSEPDLGQIERVQFLRHAAATVRCETQDHFFCDIDQSKMGLPLNSLIKAKAKESSVDALALLQHEGPQYVYNGQCVTLSPSEIEAGDKRPKENWSGFETFWFQITNQKKQHRMEAFHLLRKIRALDILWYRQRELQKKNPQIKVPSKKPSETTQHLVYVFPYIGQGEEGRFHFTDKELEFPRPEVPPQEDQKKLNALKKHLKKEVQQLCGDDEDLKTLYALKARASACRSFETMTDVDKHLMSKMMFWKCYIDPRSKNSNRTGKNDARSHKTVALKYSNKKSVQTLYADSIYSIFPKGLHKLDLANKFNISTFSDTENEEDMGYAFARSKELVTMTPKDGVWVSDVRPERLEKVRKLFHDELLALK